MLSVEEKAAFLDSADRVRQAVQTRLGPNPDAAIAIRFIANLHRAVDKVAQEFSASGPASACKAGCDFCCSVRVEASEPEIFRIVRELKNWPARQVDVVLQRLQRRQAATGTDAPYLARIACAFLDDHRCSIYSIRPAVCRKAHSLSADRCREAAPELPQNIQIVAAADALINGTSQAYRQCRLPFSAHELCGAVFTALTDGTAEARWQRGEAVFSDN